MTPKLGEWRAKCKDLALPWIREKLRLASNGQDKGANGRSMGVCFCAGVAVKYL